MHLTTAQRAQLDALFEESLPTRRRLHNELVSLQAQLARLMASGVFDDDEAASLVARTCALEKQRNVVRTMMLVRMFRVLTPYQRGLLDRVTPHQLAPDHLAPHVFQGPPPTPDR
jgi:Spy/CpxP family protein refolding chaperone